MKLVQWQTHPDSQLNIGFVRECEATGVEKGRPVCFLCRCGVRSMHARSR